MNLADTQPVEWSGSVLARLGTIAATVLAGFFAVGAHADPIGPNCSTCDGAIYTLSYSGSALPDADPLHETFRITLDIDTNTYSGGGTFLDEVAIKVTNSLFAVSLFSAPGGLANWTAPAIDSGINANGCSGSGTGFTCVDGLANGGKGVAVTTGNGPGTDYSFVFDVSMTNGSLFTGLNPASIKARYVKVLTSGPHAGNVVKAGSLLSEDITLQGPPPVPEPAVLALIGMGLVAVACSRRRRTTVPMVNRPNSK